MTDLDHWCDEDLQAANAAYQQFLKERRFVVDQTRMQASKARANEAARLFGNRRERRTNVVAVLWFLVGVVAVGLVVVNG